MVVTERGEQTREGRVLFTLEGGYVTAEPFRPSPSAECHVYIRCMLPSNISILYPPIVPYNPFSLLSISEFGLVTQVKDLITRIQDWSYSFSYISMHLIMSTNNVNLF